MNRHWIALALAGLLASPAQAERADREKPLNYEANTGECDDLKQVCVLAGDVVLVKGTMRATGERVQIRKDPEGYQYGLIEAAPGTPGELPHQAVLGDATVEHPALQEVGPDRTHRELPVGDEPKGRRATWACCFFGLRDHHGGLLWRRMGAVEIVARWPCAGPTSV